MVVMWIEQDFDCAGLWGLGCVKECTRSPAPPVGALAPVPLERLDIPSAGIVGSTDKQKNRLNGGFFIVIDNHYKRECLLLLPKLFQTGFPFFLL